MTRRRLNTRFRLVLGLNGLLQRFGPYDAHRASHRTHIVHECVNSLLVHFTPFGLSEWPYRDQRRQYSRRVGTALVYEHLPILVLPFALSMRNTSL